MRPIAGLHHVTAIAGPAQACLDLHAGVLGQRLVKRTVNFDDPETWHLYFGDGAGAPGTLLTFFPWAGAPRGRRGTGEAGETALAVPADSLDWWGRRLAAHGVAALARGERFGTPVLTGETPDGLDLALVAEPGERPAADWTGARVPAPVAVRGLHGVTLTLVDPTPTRALLVEVMGLRSAGREGARERLVTGGTAAATIDLVARPGVARAALGTGSVHHIAWRVADDADQLAWSEVLERAGMRVTEVRDRCYFHSVYFRDPSGVLHELATDPPGFTVDEPAATLGGALRLPPWLEPMRTRIAERLAPLGAPAIVAEPA